MPRKKRGEVVCDGRCPFDPGIEAAGTSAGLQHVPHCDVCIRPVVPFAPRSRVPRRSRAGPREFPRTHCADARSTAARSTTPYPASCRGSACVTNRPRWVGKLLTCAIGLSLARLSARVSRSDCIDFLQQARRCSVAVVARIRVNSTKSSLTSAKMPGGVFVEMQISLRLDSRTTPAIFRAIAASADIGQQPAELRQRCGARVLHISDSVNLHSMRR